MKRFLSLLLALVILTTTAGAVDLYVDTELIDTDTPPTIVDGRTLVPLRAIFEAIGAQVDWDQETRTATGTKDGTRVVIRIDSTKAFVNGEPRTLDVPAQIINGRTMVPARFVSEAMDCEVTWDQDTKTAAVANELKGKKIYVTATGKRYHYSSTCNGGTYYEATLAEAMGRGLTPCDKCVLTVGGVAATAPDTKPESKPATEPTASQKAALEMAKQYLDLMPFSSEGLIGQLEYEGCAHADAVYAADNCGADWNAQALEAAKNYLDVTAFSREGLVKQLVFDKYTEEQATYAVDHCTVDWNAQAVQMAEEYLEVMDFTRDRLIAQLEYEGFTHEQAVYGVEQNGF